MPEEDTLTPVISDEQMAELKAAAQPLWDWLRKHGDPNIMVQVRNDRAELLGGVAQVSRRTFAEAEADFQAAIGPRPG